MIALADMQPQATALGPDVRNRNTNYSCNRILKTGKVVRAHVRNSGELRKGEFAGQVRVDMIDDAPQPVGRVAGGVPG